MKLKELYIDRMPGLAHRPLAFTDLSRGLNLIVGPNGSGKTTTCRAIRGLLWPNKLKGTEYPVLRSQWRYRGQPLTLELAGRQYLCQLNGESRQHLPLPQDHLADCFFITIDELFDGSATTDSDLAALVRREMSGGFNLYEIASNDQWQFSRHQARRFADTLTETSRKLRHLQREQSALQVEEQQLTRLREELEAGERAADQIHWLEQREQLTRLDAQLSEIRNQLAQYPEQISRLLGNELQQYEEIDLRKRTCQDECQQLQKRLLEFDSELAALELPTCTTLAEDLATARRYLESLRNIQERIQTLEEQVQEQGAKLNACRKRLRPVNHPEQLEQLDEHALEHIEAFYRTWERLRAEQDAVAERLKLLIKTRVQGNRSELEQGLTLLRKWLRIKPATVISSRQLDVLFATVIMAFVAVGVAAATLINPWWSFTLAPPALASMLFWRIRQSNSESIVADIVREYGTLNLEQPVQWREGVITKLLRTIEANLIALQTTEQKLSEAEHLRAKLRTLNEQAEDLAAERDRLTQRIGVSLDIAPYALSMLTSTIVDFQQTLLRQKGLLAALGEKLGQRKTVIAELNKMMSQFQLDTVEDYEHAAAKLEILTERLQRFEQLRQEQNTLSRDMEHLQATEQECQEALTKLFTTLGLPPVAEAELRALAAQLPEYHELASQRKILEHQARNIRAELIECAPEVLDLPESDLTSRKIELQARRERLTEVSTTIGSIEARIEQARRSLAVEEALARDSQARKNLENYRDHALRVATAEFLLHEIENEYEAESQPEVFKQADQLLREFTRGQYELRPARSDSEPSFHAFDTTTGTTRALHELSQGTKMQLLLAARLAFAIKSEGELKLPIILDEALSNTDPVRFRAIAEALINLIQDGRQILYFSCQPNDATAWQQLARTHGLKEIKVTYLDRPTEDSLAPVEPMLLEPSINRPVVPPPNNRGMLEYCKLLNPPELKAGLPAHEVDLAHLLDDPDELYLLRVTGIRTFGQLKALTERPTSSAYISAEAFQRAAARAAVIDAFAAARRVGRGTPLTPEALATALPSSKFITELVEVAEQSNWDAKIFLKAVDPDRGKVVKRFGRKSYNQLFEHLLDAGCYSAATPLSEDQARAFVLSEVNDFVQQGSIGPEQVAALFDYLWDGSGWWEQTLAEQQASWRSKQIVVHTIGQPDSQQVQNS